jgi:membrane protein implicated in regulation of membrane protease activity
MPPMPIVWLIVAGVLLLLEVTSPGFDGLLVGAIGALLASLISAALPVPLVLQMAVFLTAAVLGAVWMFGWSRRRSPRQQVLHEQETGAVVITAFDQRGEGRVRWHGQSWAAVALGPGRELLPGMRVTVMGREGTRLQVMEEGGGPGG